MTKDSPRWCDHCGLWGDHHTDRHDPDRYKAHLESGLQSVVAANRELANHNLQEYRNLRERTDDLVRAVEAYWPNSQPPHSIQTAIRKLRGEAS